MSSEDHAEWEKLDRLLEQALAREPAERAAFLDDACAGDSELRSQLDGLLQVADSSPTFLDEGALALASPALGEILDETPLSAMDEHLGSYRIVEEIGRGGMSCVYLAERDDGEFARQVAIKVLERGGAYRGDFEQRFKTERQILASFDHPSIARVFDGGVTADGRPYLVMDYVSGEPLTTFCQRHELGLEARLELFQQVCEAVHYAHQRLVVHRDLKPPNILVTADRRIKLLDFGIAKLLEGESSGSGLEVELPPTRTGLYLLTPEYAAPEQLQAGEVTTATDIYALGVVLFELLVGSRPFQLAGLGPHEMSRVVCEQEPPRPSAVKGDLAGSFGTRSLVDLDTIVLKALRKRPENRYGSARELSDEVGRVLAGEPVTARPISVFERAWRSMQRHPRASLAAVLATVLLVVFGAMATYARLGARARAAEAQRFGQVIERIESTLQRTYLAPLHDVGPALDEVRRQMDDVRSGMAGLSESSRALADYALGRGHLGLGEEERARFHLERAWSSGYQESKVALALGLTLSRLYRSALGELSQVHSSAARASRRAEIEARFRDPAVRALEQASPDPGQAELIAALLDFFAGRSEQALQRLGESSDPWFYEPHLLAGDIYSELQRSAARGGRSEEADRLIENATLSYQRAIEIARSDPRGYEGLCSLRSNLLSQRYYASQEDLAGVREAAKASCGLAIRANPQSARAFLNLGQAERLWASLLSDLGEDPLPLLRTSLENLDRAVELEPENPRPLVIRGAVYRAIASHRFTRGQDPVEAYNAALSNYQLANQLAPSDYDAHSSRSLTELHLGDFERRRGGPAADRFQQAIASAEKAVSLLPDHANAHINLGIAYQQLALVLSDDHEVTSLFDAGAAALRRAIEINPELVVAKFNLGNLLRERAEHELSKNRDPTSNVDAATAVLDEVKAAWPDFAPTYMIRALAEAVRARWARQSDAAVDLTEALDWVARGTALKVNEPEVFSHAARIYLLRAQWEQEAGRSSRASIETAKRYLERALSINAKLVSAYRLQAEAHWREALASSQDPRGVLQQGLAAAGQALALNPRDAQSHLQVARIEQQWASWLARQGLDATDKVQATRLAVDKALEVRPSLTAASELLVELQRVSP